MTTVSAHPLLVWGCMHRVRVAIGERLSFQRLSLSLSLSLSFSPSLSLSLSLQNSSLSLSHSYSMMSLSLSNISISLPLICVSLSLSLSLSLLRSPFLTHVFHALAFRRSLMHDDLPCIQSLVTPLKHSLS